MKIKTDKEVLIAIANSLDGIERDDLTHAEKVIARELLRHGILRLDIDADCYKTK